MPLHVWRTTIDAAVSRHVFYCPIGFADRTKTEVVRPTVHPLIELLYNDLGVQ
jgi:hypothetical protein